MDSGNLPGTRLQPQGSKPDEKGPYHSQSDEERWAEAIAEALLQGAEATVQRAGLGPLPPEAWRHGVDPLTQPSGGQPGPAPCCESQTDPTVGSHRPLGTGVGPETTEVGRVQVRLATAEFGELALVVERKAGGLSVVVASVDPRALALFSAEQMALQEALRATGQAIESIQFVRMNEVGIDLAQSRSAPGVKPRGLPKEAAEEPRPGARRRRVRRLDLIG